MITEAISIEMLELSKKLEFLKEFSFYLAGGTGLALQLGHRKSIDMDFFTSEKFSPEELSNTLRSAHLKLEKESRSHLTLHGTLEGVRVSFIYYEVNLLFPRLEFNSILIADYRDIIAEKARTIADRGKKKDFYDFYFGLQIIDVEKTTELICGKFGKRINYFHILKGLTYFEDAENDPPPVLLKKDIGWDNIKEFFINKIKDFEKYFALYETQINF